MASKFNVDFLRRSDLIFELYSRNYKSDEVVNALRKRLRLLLAQEVLPDKKYIIVDEIPDQINLCKQDIQILQNDADNLDETTSRNDSLRYRDRLNCFINRINLLREASLENNLEDCNAELETLLVTAKDLLIELNGKFPMHQCKTPVPKPNQPYDAACGHTDQNLGLPNIPIQNLSSPVYNVNELPEQNCSVLKINLAEPNNTSCFNPSQNPIPYNPTDNTNTFCNNEQANFSSSNFTSFYSKLPNPAAKLLSDLPCIDGLFVNSLLKFLRIVLRILSAFPELKSHIFSLLVPHARGPFLECLLRNRSTNNFDSFHNQVIKNFIPERQLLNFQQTLFWRKQADNENLADYISDIKETAVLLRLNLSEESVVNNILDGINYKVRACCTFYSRPKVFADLDKLCVDVMNVQFIHKTVNNFEKPTSFRTPNRFPVRPSNSSNHNVCFYCRRPGHVKQQCPVLLNKYPPKNL